MGSITDDQPWYVYVLTCADNSLYTGITTDLQRRVKEHNELQTGAKYTRTRRPVVLAHSELFSSRSEATKREYAIKKLGRQAKLALLNTANQNNIQ